MTPDLEGHPPPHERKFRELLTYYPEREVLKRLFMLKKQVDPFSIFDGSGTIPFEITFEKF